MPYAQPFIRVTFGGELAAGQEIWSCNFHLIKLDAIADPVQWFEDNKPAFGLVSNEISSLISDPLVQVPSGVELEWVKFALVGVNGEYLEEPYLVGVTATGGTARGYLPQGAVVTSFVADKLRDPGKYNRFYLPVCPPVAADAYSLDTGTQAGYSDRMGEFVDEINDIMGNSTMGADAWFGVVSGTRSGSQLPVAYVRVGRIIDTQRRRRNALQEAYNNTPVVMPT